MSPYRTGALLTLDAADCGCKTFNDHFREATGIGLRASGSRQLDVEDYKRRIDQIKSIAGRDKHILVVDLRQESHLYFDGRAVSWYADRDWSNVGRSVDWILTDEHNKLKAALKFKQDDIFFLMEDADGSVSIALHKTIKIQQARTEEEELAAIDSKNLSYLRVPVSDHCQPGADAIGLFLKATAGKKKFDWIHFHCHGGDGRTTSFLALYDMVCWRRENPGAPMLSMREFNDRQQQLPFKYNLCPGEPTNWKYPLALARWECLDEWRERIGRGDAG